MRIAIGGVRGIPARYGGFETSVEETACRMQELGHQVSVYCRSRSGNRDAIECPGVKLIHLNVPAPNSLETIVHSIAVGLNVFANRSDFDVVHMYNAASVFGGLIVKAARKPLVMTLDGVEWKREKWNWLARLVWRLSTRLAVNIADTVVCDSQTVRSMFEARYGKTITYIPYGAKNPANVTDAYRDFGITHKKYFIFVGRLVPEKQVDILLEAYSKLSTDMPLVIVGDNEVDPDYVASLRSRARKNVLFLGYRYGETYESLLAHARVYLTASNLEGTSPSLLAAMGAQVACLVNSIPENRETGGDAVVYFDGSINDLVEKWEALANHEDLVNSYAASGSCRVKTYYDWDAVTGQYIDIYSKTLNNSDRLVMPSSTSQDLQQAWERTPRER